MEPLKRTFAAKSAKTEAERIKYNEDALTSEYYPSCKYLVREPYGENNQYISHTFKTKTEATNWINSKK